MGSYLLIPIETDKEILRRWFEYHKPFYNDFGEAQSFKDIFGDKIIIPKGYIRFKYGVQKEDEFKQFYTDGALKEIKDIKGVIEE